MEVRFKRSFLKDLEKVKNKRLKDKLKEVISAVKEAKDINEIRNIKKLKGYKDFYRIRLGNYRIGIKLEGETLIFVRFLHRKDIYKFFP